MTQSVMTGAGYSVNAQGSATTQYGPFGGAINANGGGIVTEAQAKTKNRGACTVLNGYCYVNTNARSGGSTVKTRINGADGTLAVSITGSTTGMFHDITHSDNLADGDLWNCATVTT